MHLYPHLTNWVPTSNAKTILFDSAYMDYSCTWILNWLYIYINMHNNKSIKTSIEMDKDIYVTAPANGAAHSTEQAVILNIAAICANIKTMLHNSNVNE